MWLSRSKGGLYAYNANFPKQLSFLYLLDSLTMIIPHTAERTYLSTKGILNIGHLSRTLLAVQTAHQ